MSIVPAAGFARSSGTVTAPHRTPGGHAVCACAAAPSTRPQSSSVHVAASATAALRASLRGERDMPMTPFVVAMAARRRSDRERLAQRPYGDLQPAGSRRILLVRGDPLDRPDAPTAQGASQG